MARAQERQLSHVALGANLGDRLASLRGAVSRLRALGEVAALSSLYETEPVGPPPKYLNAVLALATSLPPEELLGELLAIERSFGRVRSEKNAPRTLDLDLLLVGDRVLHTPALELPHPRLHERAFVLYPLAEIAPDQRHPLLHCSMSALRDRLGSAATVERVAGPEALA